MPTGTLGKAGKKLWEQVYNESIASGDKKEVAAQKAWGAVKSAGWKKVDGEWMKKSDSIVEFSMYITKSSLDNGVMRWAATNSDTDKDLYQERMSLELYQDFIKHIKNNEDIPMPFKSLVASNYWQKGMPYVSVSHYPDINGDAVPGMPTEIFIDGDKFKARLKAKGILFDTPLGRAVWKSLKEDKDKSPEDKIRISIGFLDFEHKHGEHGVPFERKSIYALCPQCLEGVGDKIYTKGYLVHLALTRVPVNQRTEMVLEEKADMTKKKTRKEDAASIVGDDLANEIEQKSKNSVVKSDVLIEMSDSQETAEETQELIEEAENNEVVSEETPEVSTPVAESETVEKAETAVEKMDDDEMTEHMPYGGAVSMKEAEQSMKDREEAMYVMDMWGVFQNVAWNIFDRKDVTDKRKALKDAVDEFKSVLAAKAMVAFSVAQPEVVAPVETEPGHELQPAIDLLLESVDNSVSLRSDAERAEVLNPVLQQLGKNIMDYLERKSIVEKTEQPAHQDDNNLLKEIKDLIQPLSERLGTVIDDVAMLKAKSQATSVEVKPRIPAPRTISANLIQNSAVVSEQKPSSLRSIIRKSVGISE